MARRTSRFFSVYLILPAAIWVLLLGFQAALMAIDPYNFYPWSPARTIPEDNYSTELAPYLLNIVRRSSVDTAMIGGSTAVNFLPADIRDIMGAKYAANLSYDAPRTEDMALVLDKLSDAPQLKHLLLMLDYQYTNRMHMRRPLFPYELYDSDIAGRVLIFDKMAARLSLRILRGQGIANPENPYSAFRAQETEAYKTSLLPTQVAYLTKAINSGRNAVNAAGHKTCADFPMLTQKLIPFAHTMSRQGKRLDIIIPPLSLAYYYNVLMWPTQPGFDWHASLDNSLMLRRCVVFNTAGIKNVRIFGFDDERWLVEDMGNYYEPGHLHKLELFRYMLREIKAGRHQLTIKNFDAYDRSLRKRVLGYTYRNSALGH